MEKSQSSDFERKKKALEINDQDVSEGEDTTVPDEIMTAGDSIETDSLQGSVSGDLVVCDDTECITSNAGERKNYCDGIIDTTAKGTNNLKSTINEVFWYKINSHVEEILNNLENETNESNSTKTNEQQFPEEVAENSCSKLNSAPKGTKRDSALLKAAQKGSHRRSMLEISSPDIDDNLISVFRRGMHCTDACIIRVVDVSGVFRQSHINCTIPMVSIDRAMLQENIQKLPSDSFLRIVRMQNAGSINIFQLCDVFAKRSVIKGGDILRTLAVSEMREKFDFEEQSMDKETRKVMYNKFTNMQRLDRGIGSRLKWQFMGKHDIEETDTIATLEEKASVSFSIFGADGYLTYESNKYRAKHVSMIKDAAGLYYFIPRKMLGAFGSQWNRRYRSHRYYSNRKTKSNSTRHSPPPFHAKSASSKKNPSKIKQPEKMSASLKGKVRKNSCIEFPRCDEMVSSFEKKPQARVILMSDAEIAEHKNRANFINEAMQFTNMIKDSGHGSENSQENIKFNENNSVRSKDKSEILPGADTSNFADSDTIVTRSGITYKTRGMNKHTNKKICLPQNVPVKGDQVKKVIQLPKVIGKNGGRVICKIQEQLEPLPTDCSQVVSQPGDGKVWPTMRNSSIKPVAFRVDDSRIDRKKILVRPLDRIDSSGSGTACQSSVSPTFRSATIVKQEPVIDMTSGTIAAVSRDSVPTVRLIPISGVNNSQRKRSPSSEEYPRKEVKRVGVLSKNKILTKGEVLLTTKDHIIFRIPRNVDSTELLDKKEET